MKIAIYAPHFAEYAVRLAMALSRHGRVLLILEKRNRAMECTARLISEARREVTLVEFDAYSREGLIWAGWWLPRRIALFRPTVLHVQEHGEPLTAHIVDRLARSCPAVLTVHDPVAHSGQDSAYAASARPVIEYLRRAAAGFHVHGATCEAMLRTVREVTVPVVSTSHGVICVPEPAQITGMPSADLLFFGRMQAYKGLAVLLDAFDLLAARRPELRLVLAGEGPELVRLSARIKTTAGIKVLDRFIAPGEAAALFQSASLVVLPYVDATQSGVVAAAYGNGKPVIASAVGGLVESVTNGVSGILVPPNDAPALADAIEAVLSDRRTIDRLSKGVRALAAGACNWDTITDELARFYRRL